MRTGRSSDLRRDPGGAGHGRRLLSAVAVTAVTALAVAGLAAPADAADDATGRAAHRLVADLTGAKEVPGPGDPNGSGHVVLRLRPGAGKVCARASWSRIGRPTDAHVHKGGPRVAGDVVVDLSSVVTGGRHCTSARRGLIRQIIDHPGRYYFNIHNAAYPGGAIRGQLRRG
jgi:hypothetical protein